MHNQNDTNELHQKVATLESTIATLETKVAELDMEMQGYALTDNVELLGDRFMSLEAKVKSYKEKLDNISKDLRGIKEKLEALSMDGQKALEKSVEEEEFVGGQANNLQNGHDNPRE